MRKATIEEGKICPNYKKQENQIKILIYPDQPHDTEINFQKTSVL